MYPSLVERYRTLLREMLAKRARKQLSRDDEDAYAQKLDDVWNVLTEDEQAELEHDLAQAGF